MKEQKWREMDNKHVGSWINCHVNLEHRIPVADVAVGEQTHVCISSSNRKSVLQLGMRIFWTQGTFWTNSHRQSSGCSQSPLNHPVAVQDVLQHPYSTSISNAVALSIHCKVSFVKWMYIALNGGIVILIHSSDLHSLLQPNLYRPQHNTSYADDNIFLTQLLITQPASLSSHISS